MRLQANLLGRFFAIQEPLKEEMSRLLTNLVRWLINNGQMRPHHRCPGEIIKTSNGKIFRATQTVSRDSLKSANSHRPAAKAYLLPEILSLREAALIEPVSCVVRGLHCLNPKSGDTFLIAGAGMMGLLLLQLALRGGASRVAVVDVNTQRLTRAQSLGATRTYTTIQQVLADEPLGFNCVIDATGVAMVIEQAFKAVKRSGKLLIFGVAADEARISLSPFRIYNEEITIVGSMAVFASFQPALDLISGGTIDTQAMLTAALPLEGFSQALGLVQRGEGVKT